MKWKLFTAFRNRRKLKQLKRLSESFGYVSDLYRNGLIYWKAGEKVLLFEESCALMFLSEGKDGFKSILQHIINWQNFQNIQEAYEQKRLLVEAEAVRRAQTQDVNLSDADIQRIRQEARWQMEEIPADQLSVVKEYDIMIIRRSAISEAAAKKTGGLLVAVGHYDGQHLDMALYDDIKHNLIEK